MGYDLLVGGGRSGDMAKDLNRLKQTDKQERQKGEGLRRGNVKNSKREGWRWRRCWRIRDDV